MNAKECSRMWLLSLVCLNGSMPPPSGSPRPGSIQIDVERRQVIFFERKLPCPAITEGHELWLIARRSGLPAEAFSELALRTEDDVRIIKHTNDLRGIVKIAKSDEALSFCRLFTEADTHYLFDDSPGMEILTISHSNQKADAPKSQALSNDNWKRLGLEGPRVQRHKYCFIVERSIVAWNQDHSTIRIFRSTERIGFEGSYAYRVKRIVKRQLPYHEALKYGIRMPTYM